MRLPVMFVVLALLGAILQSDPIRALRAPQPEGPAESAVKRLAGATSGGAQ